MRQAGSRRNSGIGRQPGRRIGRKDISGRDLSVESRRMFFKEIYDRFHRAEFISPDPLEFVYHYDDPLDREIAGLTASSLAYGRVAQILKSVSGVLGSMGPSPRAYLESVRDKELRETFHGFKHRFTTEDEIVDFLGGIRDVIRKYGSLRACFLAGSKPGDDTTIPAVSTFVREIDPHICVRYNSLLPDPVKKSACKRLHLFLRWMVRSDDIDPGGWGEVSPARLVIPLDTHMFHICSILGMTSRSQADEKAVREITEAFRKIDCLDPVKYDFSLTRMGIRREGDIVNAIDRYMSRQRT